MLKLLTLILSLYFVNCAKAQTVDVVSLEETCTPVPGLFIENRTREIECCGEIIADVYRSWSTQTVYLTKTFATLKSWNCPQLDQFCSNRSLGFTEYTALVYDRFCDESQLLRTCENVLRQAISDTKLSESSGENAASWTDLVERLDPRSLTVEELAEPCIQVALYDAASGGPENYHELVSFIVPFCASTWCGLDYDSIERNNITPWLCLPARCKANVIILVIIYVILSALIIAANFTVILVYSTEKKSRHSQGVFRLSLGFADMMVGLIVFPSAIGIALNVFQHSINLQSPVNVTGLVRSEIDNTSFQNSSAEFQMVETRVTALLEILPIEFRNFAGLFSTLSLTVSIYLLTVSGIDRLLAISRPVSYRQHQAKRFAYLSSITAWLCAFIIALLPVFVDGMRYEITGTGIVTLIGGVSLILYAVGFILPLIVTWGVSIAMYVYSRKSFERRANMSTIRHQQIEQQRRLNRILSLMVTAFSVSIIPTILVLILIFFIPGTNPELVNSYSPLLSNLANSLEAVATIILLSNSLWNCLIYSIRTKHFRKTALQKYRSIWQIINPVRWCSRFKCCKDYCEAHSFPKKRFAKSVTITTSSAKTTNTANATGSTSCDSRRSPCSSKKPRPNYHQEKTNSAINESSIGYNSESADSKL